MGHNFVHATFTIAGFDDVGALADDVRDRPSGSWLEGCERSTAAAGITDTSRHCRCITVNAAQSFGGRSASQSPKLGCNGLQRGCTGATRPGQK